MFGPCGTRVRLNVFGAVFGAPGVFGSCFTVVFGSVRQETNVCLVLRLNACSCVRQASETRTSRSWATSAAAPGSPRPTTRTTYRRLSCSVLYRAILCYAMLCYSMLRYSVLHYTILYYTFLYFTVLHFTILLY